MMETLFTVIFLILLTGIDPWLDHIPQPVMLYGKGFLCIFFLVLMWAFFAETPPALQLALTGYTLWQLWRVLRSLAKNK
jgi:hypothetical protein